MNEIQKAIGGQHLEVNRVVNGELVQEQVFVRELSIKMTDAATRSFGDDAAMIALCTGKDIEWVGSLRITSVRELIAAIQEVNADFFAYCEERQTRMTKIQERTMPGLLESVKQSLVTKALEELKQSGNSAAA